EMNNFFIKVVGQFFSHRGTRYYQAMGYIFNFIISVLFEKAKKDHSNNLSEDHLKQMKREFFKISVYLFDELKFEKFCKDVEAQSRYIDVLLFANNQINRESLNKVIKLADKQGLNFLFEILLPLTMLYCKDIEDLSIENKEKLVLIW